MNFRKIARKLIILSKMLLLNMHNYKCTQLKVSRDGVFDLSLYGTGPTVLGHIC
jgi:hypothetical protein